MAYQSKHTGKQIDDGIDAVAKKADKEYVEDIIGDIETILETITTGSGV